MKSIRVWVVLINLIIILGYFNYAVYKKEKHLKNGKIILLELAPVDPRSLIQGDYMDLRYAISDSVDFSTIPKRGYCIIKIDNNNIAHRVRFQKDIKPINDNELPLRYYSADGWNIALGAESYFFQEGKAKLYEKAKYGALKVDEDGNCLLVALYDEQRNPIK